jgi:hypothetical protein
MKQPAWGVEQGWSNDPEAMLQGHQDFVLIQYQAGLAAGAGLITLGPECATYGGALSQLEKHAPRHPEGIVVQLEVEFDLTDPIHRRECLRRLEESLREARQVLH